MLGERWRWVLQSFWRNALTFPFPPLISINVIFTSMSIDYHHHHQHRQHTPIQFLFLFFFFLFSSILVNYPSLPSGSSNLLPLARSFACFRFVVDFFSSNRSFGRCTLFSLSLSRSLSAQECCNVKWFATLNICRAICRWRPIVSDRSLLSSALLQTGRLPLLLLSWRRAEQVVSWQSKLSPGAHASRSVCVELEKEERSKRRTMELASGASSLPSFSLGREM